MKRPGPPPRRAWIRRRTQPIAKSSPGGTPRTRKPIKTVKKAKSSAKQTANWRRAFGSVERVEFVKALPSVASGKGPCVNAHVRTGGTSRKADACWIVPLTDYEHRHELHQHGARWFEAKYSVDLEACAVATEAAWLTHLEEAA